MNYIGEYTQNSEILLELVTKDENNQPIHADFPPTAIVEYFDGNGLAEVGRVTLETIGIGRYFMPYYLSETSGIGTYIVKYEALLDGVSYTDRERFQVIASKVQDKIRINDLTLLSPTNSYTTIIINGIPVKGATVNIWTNTETRRLIAKTTTDADGHWNAEVAVGSYYFEFIHPDGTLLRGFDKVVK